MGGDDHAPAHHEFQTSAGREPERSAGGWSALCPRRRSTSRPLHESVIAPNLNEGAGRDYVWELLAEDISAVRTHPFHDDELTPAVHAAVEALDVAYTDPIDVQVPEPGLRDVVKVTMLVELRGDLPGETKREYVEGDGGGVYGDTGASQPGAQPRGADGGGRRRSAAPSAGRTSSSRSSRAWRGCRPSSTRRPTTRSRGPLALGRSRPDRERAACLLPAPRRVCWRGTSASLQASPPNRKARAMLGLAHRSPPCPSGAPGGACPLSVSPRRGKGRRGGRPASAANSVCYTPPRSGRASARKARPSLLGGLAWRTRSSVWRASAPW